MPRAPNCCCSFAKYGVLCVLMCGRSVHFHFHCLLFCTFLCTLFLLPLACTGDDLFVGSTNDLFALFVMHFGFDTAAATQAIVNTVKTNQHIKGDFDGAERQIKVVLNLTDRRTAAVCAMIQVNLLQHAQDVFLDRTRTRQALTIRDGPETRCYRHRRHLGLLCNIRHCDVITSAFRIRLFQQMAICCRNRTHTLFRRPFAICYLSAKGTCRRLACIYHENLPRLLPKDCESGNIFPLFIFYTQIPMLVND